MNRADIKRRVIRRPTPDREVRTCSTCGQPARRRWVGDPWVHEKKPAERHAPVVPS